MLDRTHIEKILRLNGLSPDAPEEQIKTVLMQARWHQDDVSTAILILQGKQVIGEEENELRKILNSDHKIAPETLNALLGVDSVVENITAKRLSSARSTYRKQIISLTLLAICFASLFILFVMWQARTGIFAAA